MGFFWALPRSDSGSFCTVLKIFQSVGFLFLCVSLFQQCFIFGRLTADVVGVGGVGFHLLCWEVLFFYANQHCCMRAEAVHMVPARFDMDQPLNCCKTHKDASTRADKLSLSHTHTHIFSRVCRKNVREEVTLQACPWSGQCPALG